MNLDLTVLVAAALARRFEGCYLRPYLCPAGVPTIGYGATYYEDGRRVTLADPPISKARAEALLLWMVRTKYLPAVLKLCPGADTPERLAALIDFANGYEGVPWKDYAATRPESSILALRDDRPRGLVPGGGVVAALHAAVDTQDNGFFYEIRALGWGFAQDSWCVREGFIPADWRKIAPSDLQARSYSYHPAFDTLRRVLWEDAYYDADGVQYPVQYTLIDAMGHHTTDVYDFCRVHRRLIAPFKGERQMSALYAWTDVETYPGTSRKIPGGVKLLRANVTHFKNMLADRLATDPADPGAWRYHAETDTEWARMMCAEYKNEKSGFWECPSGKANHGWDCAVYHLVAAEVRGVKMWAREPQARPKQAAQRAPVNPYTGGRQMFGAGR